MRNLAKSMMSFSWAMSLFGLDQLRHLVSDDDSGKRRERIGEDLDAVTAATKERLGERTSSMFDAGDSLQADMVDLTFDIFRGEELKPRRMLDRAADLVEESADALRDMAGEKKEQSSTDKKKKRTSTAAASA